ncbi:hypothetical protein ABIB80_004401 [Bradyrhizobium sp. i1.15.2]|uniref:hypothetical protein n=1 Tax=Bradyrhizobium sp. i1.15.2 TaxID=3156362 RepID=UPI003392C64B
MSIALIMSAPRKFDVVRDRARDLDQNKRPNIFLLSLGPIEMAKTARRGILLKFRLAHGALDVRHDRYRNRKTFKQAAHNRMSRFVIGRLYLVFFHFMRHGRVSASWPARPL